MIGNGTVSLHQVNFELRLVQKSLWKVALVAIGSLIFACALQPFDNLDLPFALLLFCIYSVGMLWIAYTSFQIYNSFTFAEGKCVLTLLNQ